MFTLRGFNSSVNKLSCKQDKSVTWDDWSRSHLSWLCHKIPWSEEKSLVSPSPWKLIVMMFHHCKFYLGHNENIALAKNFYQTQNWILLDITFSHKKVILRCPFLVCIGVNMVLVTAQSITVYGFSLIDILSIYNSVLIRKNKDERKSVFWYILLSENKLLLSRSKEWEKPQIIKKHLDWSSIQI